MAKKEVSDDISGIGVLLNGCHTDDDVHKNAHAIEKHLHKLKGLAPMMGQEEIGEVATLLDSIFKFMLNGTHVEQIHKTLADSVQFMQARISETAADFTALKSQIRNTHAKFL